MKARIWGIIAIIISTTVLAWFTWTWFALALPDSDIWEECQVIFGISYALNPLTDVVYYIFVFFVPISIISLVSNIMLFRNKKAHTWGLMTIVGSFGILLLFMIVTPSLPIEACKGASFAIAVTVQSFFILSITSLVSGIILVKVSKHKTSK